MSTTTPAAPKSKDPPPQRVGARQATTTDVWTATLTPADIATVWKGCRNNCNNAAILSDDDFTYDSIDYTIVQLTVRNNPSPLLLGLTPQITAADADGLTLVVGSTSFPFANATFAVENSARSVTWSASGLSWTVGTDVAVKITVTNNAPTVANAIPNQTATTGTAFSYRFPANTFNDTDTGDTLTYTTTKADGAVLPTWLAFDPATRIFSGTPTAAETVSLKVTASDGTASVSDEFDIVVRAADNTAPTVTSIERQDPTALLTNSDTPTWRVTFSEAVKNVDGTDFTIAGTTATPTATPVTLVPGAYDVTPTGGDIASLTGTITLTFASGQNIADTADNELAATAPTGINEPTFEMENTIPTFVSGTANSILIVLTFSEDLDPNSLPPASSFSISALSSLSVTEPVANSVSIEGAMVTLTVAPAFITDHIVQVYNNAYAGAGRVPLQDAAGNAVPAPISYSVTNETPIGPPASLRAEAGDGRVRLVWTGPAGTSQPVRYEYRHAAGASVPMNTAWTGTNNAEVFTALLSGLANGTPHAFELRAVHGSEVGATATVAATPLAAVCSTPDLGDRREVWSATLTVGRTTIEGDTSAGYRRGSYGSLPQDGNSFMIGRASYTIKDLYTVVRADGFRRRLALELVNSRRFTPAVKEALRFHWCSDSSGFADPTSGGYRASNDNQADWSLYDTREVALSLTANTDTTAPTVTSITPQDPTSSPTNSDTLTWRVTFSEAVENVDPADFVITGTTATLTVTTVTNLTGVYDVTTSGGDLDSLDGTVTLAFATDQNIVDPSDNTLTATTPTGANDPTFELDNTVPTFGSGTANGILIVLTFSEDLDPNSLPPGSAFNISTDSNVMVNKVSIEGTMVTLTVTPAIIVDQTVEVNNNAYAGTGTVPLKDFAGNEVQPAASVGSYRVTNETPIGPPASLRAEAGDGRVRLVWTRPAGISQYIDYQFRHAPGASVPVGTAWTGTASLESLTYLVSGNSSDLVR